MTEPESANSPSARENPTNGNHDSVRPVIFGVGCLDFGIQCSPSDEFGVDEYVSKLAEELETIPSLNNLSIVPWFDEDTTKIDSQQATETDNGIAVFSSGIVRRIEFDLYIPCRIQNDLALPWKESDTGTENFRVYILDAYYSTVAFVELLDPEEPQVPSTALVVIRKYLQSECKKAPDLAFTYVGPTPFHANFRIEPGPLPNSDSTFDSTAVNTRGYSEISFRYDASSFARPEAAFNKLIREIDRELGIYYALKNRDSTTYRNWNNIERLFSELISRSEDKSYWQRVRNALLHGKSVRNLSIELARFQAKWISDESFVRTVFYDAYERGMPSYLKTYIQAEMAERPTFPIEPVAGLLGFFERRRSKGLELLVILAAAIVGGVAGSLFTIFANQGHP